jgi:hypothetical protein
VGFSVTAWACLVGSRWTLGRSGFATSSMAMVCGFVGFVLWVCGGGWVCFGMEVRVVCGGLTKHRFMEVKGFVEQI